MNYYFKVIDVSGKIISGEYIANSVEDVENYLYSKNYKIIRIDEENREFSKDLHLKVFNNKKLHIFLYKLYILLSSNITLPKAMEIIRNGSSKKEKKVFSQVLKDINSSKTLSESLDETKEFPKFLTNMILIGEESSNLPEILKSLSEFYLSKDKFNKKVQSALSYPILLLIVTIIIINILVLNILPNFAEIFGDFNKNLPLMTRILIGLSKFINTYIIFIFIFVIGFVILAFWWINTEKGKLKLHKFLYRSSTYKTISVKEFLSGLKFLIKAHLPIPRAIQILNYSISNEYLKQELGKTLKNLYEGQELSKSLPSDIFSNFDISMINVGEESANMLEILVSLDKYYSEEVEFKTERFINLFQPILILVMAIIVGLVVVSIALPIFDLVNLVE